MSKTPGPFGNLLIVPLLVVVLVSGLAGCKVRHTQPPVVKEERNPENKSAPDLQQLISEHAFKATSLTAKASVQTISGDEENSFNINLRMVTDSAIWISISPLLGIEVARILIDRDSVMFFDRINKKYAITDYKYLNDLLQMNIDFEIIQGVFTGNLFAYKKNKFNSVYVEDKYYILSTMSKRRLKRSLEEEDSNSPVVQDIWIDDTNYRITRLSVEDHRVNKSMLTNYEDHRITDGGLFPFKSNTVIKAGKELHVTIAFQKLNLNVPVEFPFTIPQGYEKVQ